MWVFKTNRLAWTVGKRTRTTLAAAAAVEGRTLGHVTMGTSANLLCIWSRVPIDWHTRCYCKCTSFLVCIELKCKRNISPVESTHLRHLRQIRAHLLWIVCMYVSHISNRPDRPPDRAKCKGIRVKSSEDCTKLKCFDRSRTKKIKKERYVNV